jgi:hypothetical protein
MIATFNSRILYYSSIYYWYGGQKPTMYMEY